MATRSAVLGLTAQGVSTSQGRLGEAFLGVFGTEEKLGRAGLGGLANGLGMRVAGNASLGDLLHDLEGPAILEGFRALGERGLSAARDIEDGLNASKIPSVSYRYTYVRKSLFLAGSLSGRPRSTLGALHVEYHFFGPFDGFCQVFMLFGRAAFLHCYPSNVACTRRVTQHIEY